MVSWPAAWAASGRIIMRMVNRKRNIGKLMVAQVTA
jgi:hypothetical protein